MNSRLRISGCWMISLLAVSSSLVSASDIVLLENYVSDHILSGAGKTLDELDPIESITMYGVALGANQRSGGVDAETFTELDKKMRENIQILAAFAGDQQEATQQKLMQLYQKALSGEHDTEVEARYGFRINALPPLQAQLAEVNQQLHDDPVNTASEVVEKPRQNLDTQQTKQKVVGTSAVAPEITSNDNESILAMANQFLVSTKAADLDALLGITTGEAKKGIEDLRDDEKDRAQFRALAQALNSWDFGEPHKDDKSGKMRIVSRIEVTGNEAFYVELFFEKDGSTWKISHSDELNNESPEARSLDPKYRELIKEIGKRTDAFMNHMKEFQLSGMLEFTDEYARDGLLDILADRDEMEEIRSEFKDLQWKIEGIDFEDTENATVTILVSTAFDKDKSVDLHFELVNGQWLIVDFDLF